MLSGGIEENVITMLCFSEKHAGTLVSRITPDIFSVRHYRLIARAAFEHIEKYKLPPRYHLRDIFEEARGEDGKKIHDTLHEMERLDPEVQPEFVLEQLDQFIESRHIKKAIETSADLLHSGKVKEAREALYSADRVHPHSPGIWLDDPAQSLSFLDSSEEDFFTSGIGYLDKQHICPARQTLMVMIAETNKGKSHWLVDLGKKNMLAKHKVLHITLEMSERQTALRYVQSFFGLTSQDVGSVKIPHLQEDVGALVDYDIITPMVVNADNRKAIEKKMKGLKRLPPLLIKGFAGGTLSAGQLRGYLDSLERQHQFKPDLLLVDYGDLMSIPSGSQEVRHAIGRNFIQLRAIAQEYDLAVVSPTQTNRTASKAKMVTRYNIGEDWSKAQTADTIITYNQTDAEFKMGLARIYVDKARFSGSVGHVSLITQSYSICNFCIDSIYMNKHVEEEIQRSAANGADTTDAHESA